MAKPTIPGWLRTTGFALLAILLLIFAFDDVDLNKVWASAKEAKWGYIMLSIALGYTAVLSRGKRWTYVLRHLGYSTSTWRAVHATGVGYLVNMAIPRAGEVARATALNRADNIPVNVLIGTILIERTIDLLMMAGLLGLAFIGASGEIQALLDITQQNTDGSPKSGGFPWMSLFGGIVGLVLIFAVFFQKQVRATAFYTKLVTFLEGMMEGVRAVGQLPNKWAFWGHTFFIWACYYVMVYVCFYALPFTANFTLAQGLFVMMAASLGVLVPVPGGVGAYHYLVAMALVVLGLPYEQGLAFATIVHAAQALMLISSGVIGLIALSARKGRTSFHGKG
ncbi:MAG: lysylphosphatidylglycerol synthase transmembrane domain-containing protein [Cryomorphaceae bacterium]|jgi:glycosyltransferase 2 family protein|nr:flippase-like domain-containing protein [Cryomorphaceae bacterium]